MSASLAPRKVRSGGRGRSVATSRTETASSCFRQNARWPSSRSPCSHSRCQTAKSTYWIGGSPSGDGSPALKAAWSAVSSRRNTLRKKPSDTMWCMMSASTCSSSASFSSSTRRSGPRVRSKGRCTRSLASRTTSASASAAGKRSQIHHMKLEALRRADHLNGSTFFDVEGGPQYLVSPDDLLDAPRQRFDVERAANPQKRVVVVGEAVRIQLIEEPQSLLCERQREAARVPRLPGDRVRLEISSLLAQSTHEKLSLLGGERCHAFTEISHRGSPVSHWAAQVAASPRLGSRSPRGGSSSGPQTDQPRPDPSDPCRTSLRRHLAQQRPVERARAIQLSHSRASFRKSDGITSWSIDSTWGPSSNSSLEPIDVSPKEHISSCVEPVSSQHRCATGGKAPRSATT